MTYIDLLQYILNVQNVEKRDLARFIDASPKKLDKILNGEKPMSRKNIKFLSAFTGIPVDNIKRGEFVLAPPVDSAEGGEASVTEPDPVTEEFNRSRLLSFLKVRHKLDMHSVNGDVVLGIVVGVLSLLLCLGCFVVFCLSKPGVSIGMFSLSFFLPVILFLVALPSINKTRKKAKYNDIKNYKVYAIFIILGTMIFNGATLYYHRNDLPAFLVITAACVMMLIDTVLRKPYSKTVFNDFFFMILTTAVMLAGFCMFLFIDTTQLLEENEEMIFYEIASVSTIVSVMASHIAIECNTGFIRTTYPAYRHFMKGEKKIGLRKKSVVKSVIAVVLAFSVFSGASFGLSIAVRKKIIDDLRPSMSDNKYKDYDKSDVVFSADEKTKTVEYGDFTIKIPAEFKEKKNKEIPASTMKNYRGKNEEAGIFLREYIRIMDENTFGFYEGMDEEDKEGVQKIRDGIIKKYGFIPKSEVESEKLRMLVLENKEINYFSKDDVAVEIYLGLFYSVASIPDTTITIYEDNEKQFYIKEKRMDEVENPRVFYTICGNKAGDYDKGFDIMGYVEYDYSDPDIIYKMINSIKFK